MHILKIFQLNLEGLFLSNNPVRYTANTLLIILFWFFILMSELFINRLLGYLSKLHRFFSTIFAKNFSSPGGGGGGLTQKCRTCMGWGGVFGTQNTKVTCTLLYNKGGVSIFYPESQKYKWYFYKFIYTFHNKIIKNY